MISDLNYNMEDKEFDKCKRELKKYLNKTKIGKLILKELNINILGHIFREGYKLGTKSKN